MNMGHSEDSVKYPCDVCHDLTFEKYLDTHLDKRICLSCQDELGTDRLELNGQVLHEDIG